VASKAAENAARLAALFHLYEHGPTGAIGLSATQAATRIVAWHLYEARRFLSDLILPKALGNAAKLDRWLVRFCLEKKAASVKLRDVQRMGPGLVRGRPELEEALRELVEAGRVRDSGARDHTIVVNPALLEGR
jgi:putative DNA primase/helicase